MRRPVELEEVAPVRLVSLRRYLHATGWRQLRRKNSVAPPLAYDVFKLVDQNHAGLQIVLPSEVASADLRYRLRDAIQTLVDAENRNPPEVIHSV